MSSVAFAGLSSADAASPLVVFIILILVGDFHVLLYAAIFLPVRLVDLPFGAQPRHGLAGGGWGAGAGRLAGCAHGQAVTTEVLVLVASSAGYIIGRGHQWFRTARYLMGTDKKKGVRK